MAIETQPPPPWGSLERATTIVFVFDSSLELLDYWNQILTGYIAPLLTRLSEVTAQPLINVSLWLVVLLKCFLGVPRGAVANTDL
jgi:hypothetical protein